MHHRTAAAGVQWKRHLCHAHTTLVGHSAGRYEIAIIIPALPLEPGSYQINLHLVLPDAEASGRRIALEGFSWLDGNGLPLEVVGEPNRGLTLPVRWKVET